jgi:HAD superfamily hydrolase (TIGR01509 family)
VKAIIFDCDGVLVDTERDGHRAAFNKAFKFKDLHINWDVKLYGELLKVAGGKERMRHFFDENGWPPGNYIKDDLIIELHKLKTDFFMKIIKNGELNLRPGIKRLVDEAIEDDVMLCVCSTSNEKAVNLIVEHLLGIERRSYFAGIFAGDIVSKKKPDPEIYNLALQNLNLRPSDCIVIEDSRNGLLAAKGAGLKCIITTNGYTEKEDFSEADMVVSELGDGNNIKISINTLRSLTN